MKVLEPKLERREMFPLQREVGNLEDWVNYVCEESDLLVFSTIKAALDHILRSSLIRRSESTRY